MNIRTTATATATATTTTTADTQCRIQKIAYRTQKWVSYSEVA